MSNVTPNTTASALETRHTEPTKKKETWILYSPTPAEYQKLGLAVPYFDDDAKRDGQTRLVQENYKRKITAIYWVRTDDDKEWLNWHETREGKTRMQRKVEFDVPNMGIKKVPVPKEEIQFDKENEEYKTVVTGEKEHNLEYFVSYNKDNLNELLSDVNPYKTAYMIIHDGQRKFTITKAEIQSGNFAKIYEAKSNPPNRLVSK